ncbi:MAG: cyclic pyranopterin monophosphate synthase MoaC [Polyangiaceae bacterium]
MPGVIYAFEDVAEDLPRPPMAAMRAFLSAGVVLSPRGWTALNADMRRTFLVAGSQPIVDALGIQAQLRNAAVAEVRLVPRVLDPNPNVIPPALVSALGPHARITNAAWAQLRPIDRYVLATLALNTRLLFRAVQEILPGSSEDDQPWKAAVAHVEISMRPDILDRLRSPGFLEGRAFMLARVAGVRAARRAQETFDLRSERATGPIELDWAPGNEPGRIIWQAHVSSWDGAFFAAAALVAASTAAVALADMVAEDDRTVEILGAKIVEEPWMVGTDTREQATAVFSGSDLKKALESGPSMAVTARNTPPSIPSAAPSNPGLGAANKSGPNPAASPGGTMRLPSGAPPMMTHSTNAPPVGFSQQALAPLRTTSPAARQKQPVPLAQNSPLLWAMFGVLTVILAALIGVIVALVSRK